MKRIRTIARQHPVLSIVLACFILVMLVFAANLARKTIYWMDPAHQAQSIEPWMTPRYIAKSWEVDAPALAAHLGLDPSPGQRPTLEDIAKARGISVEQILAETEAYLAAQSGRP